jgi:hypothetical protein
MQIKTFKVDNYRDCPVYYRNFGTHFEYLTIINGEIYTAHFAIFPTKINLLLYWLGVMPEKYSDQQYKPILKSLRRMAETTIDTILDKDDQSK